MKNVINKIKTNWIQFIVIPSLICILLWLFYTAMITSQQNIDRCKNEGGEWIQRSQLCIQKGAIIFRGY